LLEYITIKKLVFLIPSEGKKWSFHIQEGEYGGKKWDKMFICVGGKSGRGDYPPCKVPLTF
jgi:hypothetical protein